jgi:predicted transcriptional regulator
LSKQIFSISFDKEINHATNEIENSVYLRVYTSMFTSGLVAKLGVNNFATLLAIASYMDEKGECCPTLDQIAERLGVHRNSVSKYVNELLNFRIDGKPIITREIVAKGRGKTTSFYKIYPLSQISIFNGEDLSPQQETVDEDKEDKKLTPKDVLEMFCRKYREVYGVNYNANFGRDLSLIKNKLLKNYNAEEIEQIIDIGISEYDKRWKSEKYPRPTIPAICTWIPNAVFGIVSDYKKQDEIYEDFDFQSATEQLEEKARKLDLL